MSKPDDVAEFDSLIAEIMSGGPAVTTAEPEVDFEAMRGGVVEALIEAPIPTQAVAATETSKAYRVDAGKVEIEGAPFETTVYSLGYVKFKWPNFRFANQCSLYLEELEAAEAFFTSPEYQTWKQAALTAGLRKRGTKREG